MGLLKETGGREQTGDGSDSGGLGGEENPIISHNNKEKRL